MILRLYKSNINIHHNILKSNKNKIIMIEDGLMWNDYLKALNEEINLYKILTSMNYSGTICTMLGLENCKIRDIRLYKNFLNPIAYRNIICN